MTPTTKFKDEKPAGEVNIWSTTNANESATATFLEKPTKTCPKPIVNSCQSNLWSLRNCGNKSLALTIGPATNCGKKEIYVAKVMKSGSTSIFRLYRSIV